MPKDGVITHLGFNVGWKSSSPNNSAFLSILSTINADGDPTYINYGGSSGTVLIGDDFDIGAWNWIELSSPGTGSVGDIVAMRLEMISYVSSKQIATWDSATYYSSMPRFKYRTAYGTIQSNLQMHNLAIKYSDGTIYGLPLDDAFYNLISGVEEVGAKFVPSLDMRCIGAHLHTAYNYSNGTIELKIYDSTDTLLTSSYIQDFGKLGIGGDSTEEALKFYWNPVELERDETYRFVLSAMSGTASQIVYGYEFVTGSYRYTIKEGMNWEYTYRNFPGSWTDDPTRVPYLALIMDQIELSTGTSQGSTGDAGGAYGWVS